MRLTCVCCDAQDKGQPVPRSGYIAGIRELVGGEQLLVPSVTACIFDADDRLLLLRHTDHDIWATPGGIIEPGESPADAVVRECVEELGVQVMPSAILGVFGGPAYEIRYGNGDRTAYVMTVFDCRIMHGELKPDGVEVYEARFVGENDWQDLNVSRWMHDALPPLFRQRTAQDPRAVFTPPTRHH
jgi:ADP-ribose pyrophosphatase YjhB (NUDIX family)